MSDSSLENLPFAPSEDPFVVEHGGFYRRWFSMIEDMEELKNAVASLQGTTDDLWVPLWRGIGARYEAQAEAFAAQGDTAAAREKFLLAKTYYSIARFPRPLTPLKEEANRDCIRAYLRSCEFLDPPLEVVGVECEGKIITSHFRAPKDASAANPAPAVLIMCGGDMFKEDRGWAGEMALENGLASLVMDGPGTGENPFPYEPESVIGVDGGYRLSRRASRGGRGAHRRVRHQPGRALGDAARGLLSRKGARRRGERGPSLRLPHDGCGDGELRRQPEQARFLHIRRAGRRPLVSRPPRSRKKKNSSSAGR